MKIHDAEIHHRKALIGFTTEEEKLLEDCQLFINDRIEVIATIFYEKQTSFEEIALIIGDADTLKRLIAAFKHYIYSLFSGTYDLDYVNNRLRIGLVHKRIGVEPKYYISAVKALKSILSGIILQEIEAAKTQTATLEALDKLLYFDTELVFDTYIRSHLRDVEAEKNKTEKYALSLEEIVAERTKELRELSQRDGLTGLYNHRTFIEILDRDLSFAKRNSQPISLVYFDVDKFKSINDTMGHLQGDIILKSIGSILLEITRDIDIPCRYGGDEFCVVLSGSTSENADIFCKRLIEAFCQQYQDITLSIGIATTGPSTFAKPEALIKLADEAMYKSKKQQGFHVEVAVVEPELT